MLLDKYDSVPMRRVFGDLAPFIMGSDKMYAYFKQKAIVATERIVPNFTLTEDMLNMMAYAPPFVQRWCGTRIVDDEPPSYGAECKG